jgi:hypothetical protein
MSWLFFLTWKKERLGRIRAVESSPYWKPVTELVCTNKGDSIAVSSKTPRNNEGQQ